MLITTEVKPLSLVAVLLLQVTGTIAMNPEMFDLIIRGIYKNPVLLKNQTTCRELSLLISLEQLSVQKTNKH